MHLFKRKKPDTEESQFKQVQDTCRQLYDKNILLEEKLEELSTLREVALAINSILDFSKQLEVILDLVSSILNAREMTIYLCDEESKFVYPKIAKSGMDIIAEDRLKEEGFPCGEGTVGRAIEFKSSVILSEGSRNSYLIVPLLAKNTPIGAIKVGCKSKGNIFSESDKRLLSLISTQIAIAIQNAQNYERAIKDTMTKLYNKGYFIERLKEECRKSRRYHKDLCLVMIDIDHFKKFNDNYGHQTGDAVLVQLSRIIRESVRNTDIACRYGGEELSVIMPETPKEGAYHWADKLRMNIESNRFTGSAGEILNVTVSIGVSGFTPIVKNHETLIKHADEALYQSKNDGRNCTTVYG